MFPPTTRFTIVVRVYVLIFHVYSLSRDSHTYAHKLSAEAVAVDAFLSHVFVILCACFYPGRHTTHADGIKRRPATCDLYVQRDDGGGLLRYYY